MGESERSCPRGGAEEPVPRPPPPPNPETKADPQPNYHGGSVEGCPETRVGHVPTLHSHLLQNSSHLCSDCVQKFNIPGMGTFFFEGFLCLILVGTAAVGSRVELYKGTEELGLDCDVELKEPFSCICLAPGL